jgi:hypothetical protein
MPKLNVKLHTLLKNHLHNKIQYYGLKHSGVKSHKNGKYLKLDKKAF